MENGIFAINQVKRFNEPFEIKQGETFKFSFDYLIDGKRNYKLNVVGEVAIDCFVRDEGLLPKYYRKLDDSIRFKGDKKILIFNKRNQVKERTLYSMIKGLKPGDYTLSVESKIKDLNCRFTFSAEIYYGKENTRYYYEVPDQTVVIDLKESTDFITSSASFNLKEDAAFIMIKIDATGFTGTSEILSPKLTCNNVNFCPEFDYDPESINRFKWVAEGFSYFERPEFTIKLNGNLLYNGVIFDRLERFAGFSINVPRKYLKDKNEFEISYAKDNVKPYRIKEIRLINAPADFDFLGSDNYIKVNKPFGVFAYSERDDVKVEKSEYYDYLGLKRVYGNYCILNFYAKKCGYGIPLKACNKEIVIKGIVEELEGKIITGTGDFIYVSQNIDEFSEYLSWYLTENIGSLLTFRCVYHWSGDNVINLPFWRFAEDVLSALGIYFSVMRDGRELNGANLTPPDDFFNTEYYLGSQTHERDGAYIYWGQTISGTDECYYHALSRKIRYNGIYGKRSPVYGSDGTPFVYFDPKRSKDVKNAYEYFVNNLRLTAVDGAKRHTGVTTLFRSFFEAGYQWVGYESMYGPHEILLGAIRGACKCYGKNGFGTHLALQWSTVPAEDERHFIRYGLSLYLSYMHGATEINTEEGLYRIENLFSDFDKYSYVCKGHAEIQKRFNGFINTHIRRGKLKADIAMIIGKYDGMECFSSKLLFGQEALPYSSPERSWEALKVFYPDSDLNAIYYYITKGGKNNVPEKDKKLMEIRKGLYRDIIDYKQVGFYTNTPYGVIDIVPPEIDNLKDYKFLFFTGFNAASEEQLEKLCKFCENGGILLMAKPHLYDTVNREEALSGKAEIINSPLADKLLRYVKTGNLVYFDKDAYPADYLDEYANAVKTYAEKFSNNYINNTDRISYTEYVTEDDTHIFYLLNIGWWDDKPAKYILKLGNRSYEKELFGYDIKMIVVKGDTAVFTDNLFIDIEKLSNDKVILRGNGKATLYVLNSKGERKYPLNLTGRKQVYF